MLTFKPRADFLCPRLLTIAFGVPYTLTRTCIPLVSSLAGFNRRFETGHARGLTAELHDDDLGFLLVASLVLVFFKRLDFRSSLELQP